MSNNPLYDRLSTELKLRIEAGSLNKNIKTQLNDVFKLKGEAGCQKLLSEKDTTDILNELISLWEDKGNSADAIYSKKSNVIKVADVARDLFLIKVSDGTVAVDTLVDGNIVIDGYKAMTLGKRIIAAIRINYKDCADCYYLGRFSKKAAYRNISDRINGLISCNTLRAYVDEVNQPRYDKRSELSLLEKLLNVKEGIFAELTSPIPQQANEKLKVRKAAAIKTKSLAKKKALAKGSSEEEFEVDYSAKLKADVARKKLSLDALPSHVQVEWDDISTYFKRGIEPIRKPSFDDDHHSDMALVDGSTWGEKDTHEDNQTISKVCAAESKNLRDLLRYFGWLHYENGIPLDDLGLHLLAYSQLMGQYKAYKYKEDTSTKGLSAVKGIVILAMKLYKKPSAYGSRFHAPTYHLPLTKGELAAKRKGVEPQFRERVTHHESERFDCLPLSAFSTYKTSQDWSTYREVLHVNLSEIKASIIRETVNKKGMKKSVTTDDIGGQSNILWMKNYDQVVERDKKGRVIKGGKVLKVGGMVGAVKHVMKPMIAQLANWSDKKPYIMGDTSRYAYGRSAGFWSLMLVRPLRALNMACIEILPTPPISVEDLMWESAWASEDGMFHVHIPRHRIKNESGCDVTDISIVLEKGNYGQREMMRWLRLRTQMLKDSGVDSKWLFPRIEKRVLGNPSFYIVEGTGEYATVGGSTFKRHTYDGFREVLGEDGIKSLGIKSGINRHAGRHIGAYLVLELSGNDVFLAAHHLMDSPAMITAVYGKINHKTAATKLEKVMAAL